MSTCDPYKTHGKSFITLFPASIGLSGSQLLLNWNLLENVTKKERKWAMECEQYFFYCKRIRYVLTKTRQLVARKLFLFQMTFFDYRYDVCFYNGFKRFFVIPSPQFIDTVVHRQLGAWYYSTHGLILILARGK